MLLAVAALALGVDPDMTPSMLYPSPQSAQSRSGTWQLIPGAFTFKGVGSSSDVLTAGMARHATLLFRYGGTGTGIGSLQTLSTVTVNVSGSDTTLNRYTNESYQLLLESQGASNVATIMAPTAYGALRGMAAFHRLVQYNMTGDFYTVNGIEIDDFPKFEFRGVMIDTARNFMSLATLKRTCDAMEWNRLNALHLHLTDDQSWPIEIDAYPLLTQWEQYPILFDGNRKSSLDL